MPVGGAGSVRSAVLHTLHSAFGLKEVLARVRIPPSDSDLSNRFKRLITPQARLRVQNLFDKTTAANSTTKAAKSAAKSSTELPIKMEICSGTGEWVVAQVPASLCSYARPLCRY
eukprot:259586-Rhodomonas_salina.1